MGRMSGCGCQHEAQDRAQRRALRIALGLNATMFVIGIIAGWLAHSSGLMADALDMLSDAAAYAIGLMAINRGARFKSGAAMMTGTIIFLLGAGVILDAVRRWIEGSHPLGPVMMVVAFVALLVNGSVLLFVLKPFQKGEVHMRAMWLCTRADVVANLGVILSGALVLLLHSPIPDRIIGIAIGLYVIKEAIEILREAREAGSVEAVKS